MFAFYLHFSTLAAQSHYPCGVPMLKKSSLLASAPVIGMTIKSEDYRTSLIFIMVFPLYITQQCSSIRIIQYF